MQIIFFLMKTYQQTVFRHNIFITLYCQTQSSTINLTHFFSLSRYLLCIPEAFSPCGCVFRICAVCVYHMLPAPYRDKKNILMKYCIHIHLKLLCFRDCCVAVAREKHFFSVFIVHIKVWLFALETFFIIYLIKYPLNNK